MKSIYTKSFTLFSSLLFTLLLTHTAFAAPFRVDRPTPSTTFVNQPTTFSSTIADGTAVIENCYLSIDGHGAGTMGHSPGSVSLNTTITSAGTHTVRVTCYDATWTSSAYAETLVTVFADTNGPSIGAFVLTPSSPIAGMNVTIQADYDDTDFGSGINTCGLIVDGIESGLMSLSGGIGSTAGTASISYTYATAGSHSTTINCFDRSGNLGTRTQTVTVSAPATIDTTPPTVGIIPQDSVTVGTSFQHTATHSDNIGVVSCNLYIDSMNVGAMTLYGTLAARNYTYSTAGTHNAYVRCLDGAGNSGVGAVKSINVIAVSVSDTTPPVVGALSPITAVQNIATGYFASFSDANEVANCSIHVQVATGGFQTYTMSRSGTNAGSASFTWIYSSSNTPAGTYNMYATCSDRSGNLGTGPTTAVAVSSPDSLGPYATRLVKLVCPAGPVSVNDPCKAVYYVGSAGNRHAFPNEKAYFTWYTNFDGVIELDGTALASIPLGRNVNYRPGTRMVKFTTLNKVYAVGRYGELRWVTSESVATSLYGSNWNTKIDDISDTFFGDYTFGADITVAGLFSPSSEMSLVSTIDANLR